MMIKISITDDHKMIRKGIVSMLESTPGIKIVGTYENAQQTLNSIHKDKPDVLLLDEPLSALDEAMRMKLQDYILLLHHRYKITTIMVSHDIGEIFKY